MSLQPTFPEPLQGERTGNCPSLEPAIATVTLLASIRQRWRARQLDQQQAARFPSRLVVEEVVDALAAVLFPRRLGGFDGAPRDEDSFVAARLKRALDLLREQVDRELVYWQAGSPARFDAGQADTIVQLFACELPRIRELIDEDVDAAFVNDPAARSVDEILICYPGALAILLHRLAHQLFTLGAPIVARIASEVANRRTGIDIHPGATIGPAFFIDHGTGVVIGETAVIGARVQLYQHVTLGARSPLGRARIGPRDRYARHPSSRTT